MIGVLTLSALFAVSCSKEAGTTNGPQEGDCPEEMILDIKFPGQSKPSHMEIDNQRKKSRWILLKVWFRQMWS